VSVPQEQQPELLPASLPPVDLPPLVDLRIDEGAKGYAVYDRPTDYPENVVVRMFLGGRPSQHVWLFDNLEQARDVLSQLPGPLTPLPRMPGEHPSIVEFWMGEARAPIYT
jgi:hypothetical protein